MTWLLKMKRRAQNAMIAWLDFGVEPKHRRPSGDLLLDHSNNDDLEDWPPRWHTLDDVVAELGIDESEERP